MQRLPDATTIPYVWHISLCCYANVKQHLSCRFFLIPLFFFQTISLLEGLPAGSSSIPLYWTYYLLHSATYQWAGSQKGRAHKTIRSTPQVLLLKGQHDVAAKRNASPISVSHLQKHGLNTKADMCVWQHWLLSKLHIYKREQVVSMAFTYKKHVPNTSGLQLNKGQYISSIVTYRIRVCCRPPSNFWLTILCEHLL